METIFAVYSAIATLGSSERTFPLEGNGNRIRAIATSTKMPVRKDFPVGRELKLCCHQ